MTGLLADLRAETAREVQARRRRVDAEAMERRARRSSRRPLDFGAALHRPGGLAVIAEMKAASPSAGRLVEDYRPHRIARTYAAAGADAISVLCQRTSFGGSPDDLTLARRACRLPILRKDFIYDTYQVDEAAVVGADAVLLIVGMLSDAELAALLARAAERGLAALVEVHADAELERALAAGARLVGVNHRDLRTLDVEMELFGRLRPRIPAGVTVVAESGIRSGADARRLREEGADAILVGEALLRAPDPARLLEELRGA